MFSARRNATWTVDVAELDGVLAEVLPGLSPDGTVLNMQALGKVILTVGVVFVVLGVLLVLSPKIPYLGKLPGDIHVERRGVHVYFPVTTCIILSLVIMLLVRLFRRS